MKQKPSMAPQAILGRGEQSHRFDEEGMVGGAVPEKSEALGGKSEIYA